MVTSKESLNRFGFKAQTKAFQKETNQETILGLANLSRQGNTRRVSKIGTRFKTI